MPTRASFDLDAESRRALEFDDLLEWVASFARTGPGRARVLALGPGRDLDRILAELDAVEETRACIAEAGRLVAGALPDPEPALRELRVEGSCPAASRLRDLASFLLAVSDLRTVLLRLPHDDRPHLRRLGEALPDLRDEAADILHCVEPDGTLNDNASPELRRIRASSLAIGARLSRMLESYLRDPEAAPVVQDDFITQRNGRFVIPVRSDAPRQVRGIVHATSSSGATQFVEPLETVDLNNDLVRLSEREQEEQERVLRGWSEALSHRREEVVRAVDGLAEMDGLQARALFAEAVSCIRPEVARVGPLVLGSVRHPLLDRRLRAEGSGCVPLDLGLDPSDQVLVVSGPNTGGKTVAIKTLGLVVLMAQSGLPVPAAEARLPLYRQLRTDIGDRQSIEADLSTYSAHIRAVVDCLREAAPPALFLFDEIGGGTDPVEGAALAQAILEELRRPGMTAVATTHQGALKAWAFTTDGAASAAMEFDAATLRPTYRILMGAAGVSAGLEIAERLGLAPTIVARARAGLGEDARRSEDYLNRLRDLTADLERRLGEADRRTRELSDARQRIEARAERERAKRREGAERALDGALEEFRSLARKELASIRDKQQKRRAEKDVARAEHALRMERERRADEVSPAVPEAGAVGWDAPGELREGTEVYVHSLARTGRVERVRGDRVEVRLGRVAFTVRRSDLRVRAGGGDPAPAGERPAGRTGLRPRMAGPERPEELAPREIKLLGMTVDEALPALDKFLDAAALAGHQEVRVIHGHGTGRLREAVRRFLRAHVHATGQRPGRSGEGGDGATVVTLK